MIKLNQINIDSDLDPIGASIQDAIQASCTIYIKENEDIWSGSGFLIGNGLILTNHHILPGDLVNNRILVSFDGNRFVKSHIVTFDESIDAAIISVDKINEIEKIKPMKTSTESPKIGEVIAVIGSPEGWHDVVTVGRVAAIEKSPAPYIDTAWENVMFIDADINEGSSGSMVINTHGQVVGMVMGLIGKRAKLGIGQKAVIPMSKIHNSFFKK